MMLLVILNLVFVVNIVSSIGGKCTFTHDCPDPRLIQDAYEKCNFGKCKIVGGFWGGAHPNECRSFKDCKCSNNPKECFCIDGICEQEKWECHTNKDCQSMKKCKGKTCHCEGNTCEHQCSTTEDCDNPHFYCSWGDGVKCSCEDGMCRAIKITNPPGPPAPTTDEPKPICVGCPWEVTVLTEKHKEMVIFAIQQLYIPCQVKVEVIRFSEGLSAGKNYIFDVVIKYPSACGKGDHANREESECHLEVVEQSWTDILEVYKKNCKHKYKV